MDLTLLTSCFMSQHTNYYYCTEYMVDLHMKDRGLKKFPKELQENNCCGRPLFTGIFQFSKKKKIALILVQSVIFYIRPVLILNIMS